MSQIGAFEAKNRLGAILDEALQAELGARTGHSK